MDAKAQNKTIAISFLGKKIPPCLVVVEFGLVILEGVVFGADPAICYYLAYLLGR